MNQNVKLDKKKDTSPVFIHALSHDGRGMATANGKTLFIQGALPQETVTYHITHRHSRYSDATVADILVASPERASPPCAHFAICGGCSLQHISPDNQLALKQQTLLDQLNHFGQVTPLRVLPPLSSASLGYRRKARLGIRYVFKKNKLLIGFREKSSRYLADLASCVVLHPAIGQQFAALSALITSLSCYQAIPQVEVAMGDDDLALVFRHLEPLTEQDFSHLIAFAQKHHIHIYLQPNSPLPVTKLWPNDGCQRLTYTLPEENLNFSFHPLDFTQINLSMNRLMIEQAMQHLSIQPDEQVLDLFCGIGNFTLPIARRAKAVIGVEGSEEMVNRASENAKRNQIENAEFYAANLASPDPQAAWLNKSYHKILLDPPRTGAKDILPWFKKFSASKIVYISCNPATLARDAGELVHQYGYQLAAAGIMNMFPHTTHIEAMAIFEKT